MIYVQDIPNRVWLYAEADDPNIYYIAKCMDKDWFEIKAVRKIYSLRSPRNPAIPGKILESENAYILLMPYLIAGDSVDRQYVSWEVMLEHLYTIIDVRHIPICTVSGLSSWLKNIGHTIYARE